MSTPIRFGSIPHIVELRYFLRNGPTTYFDKGFRSKRAASEWIDGHGPDLEWRAGFVFRLHGHPQDLEIVKRDGERCK